jgi:TPR repeat protein
MIGCRVSRLHCSKIYKGDIVSDTHKENCLQIVYRQKQDRRQFGYIERLPATLCLALILFSGFAQADDNALIREANTALSQKDYSVAFPKFSVLAKHGNATAQFNLGAFLLNGQGVQRDEKQAYEWFAKSAAQGNVRALKILQNAAAKGNENAINELNNIQQQVENNALFAEANAALAGKDYFTAFPKFLTLAEQGNAIAQYNVGTFYLNGLGIPKDEKQAYDWFEKSAAQGYALALSVIQSTATKANENANNTPDGLAQSTAGAAPPSSEPDVKAQARDASNARSEQSRESSPSSFSLGVNLGQTGKLTGINNSPSFGLLAGYKINPSFGVELAYNSLYRNANATSMLSATTPGATGTFDLSSVSVVGQYSYGLSDNMSLLGNLGFHNSSYKISSSGSGSKTGSSSGLVAGVKVQYDLSESIGVRGGIDTYTENGGLTGNIFEIGLGVITMF